MLFAFNLPFLSAGVLIPFIAALVGILELTIFLLVSHLLLEELQQEELQRICENISRVKETEISLVQSLKSLNLSDPTTISSSYK